MEVTRNGEDRISRLSDKLIHHIMSFNDTKCAVQTSVLSKRWIDVWKTLPILNFYRSSFSENKKHSFIMFVDMAFVLRKDVDIQRFCVDWSNSAFDYSVTSTVNRWSLAAAKYNVKEVSIVITQCHDSVYEIPHRLLNCKSLTQLKMRVFGNARYVDINLPRSMNLPQLKLLSFTGFSISDVESSKRLFSSCPVLETLNIVDCGIQTDNQRNLVVDSVSLKAFEYSHWHRHLLPQNDTMANIVNLCAPNLDVFVCKSFWAQDYSLEICSPLSGVSFLMRLENKNEDENATAYSKLPSKEKEVYAKRVMKFLEAVHTVKDMRLSPGFLEVLSHAPDLLDCQPPLLCNLDCLLLDMWSTIGCLRAISYLLKISPNITAIFVRSMESNLTDIKDDWEAGFSSPGILCHLKFVQFEEVEGCDAEFKLLSLLLKNAKVLEGVVVYFRSSVGSPVKVRHAEQFQDKLSAVPTASSSVELVFH